MAELACNLVRYSLGIAPAGPLPGQFLQCLVWPGRNAGFYRILISQFVEAEAAAIDNFHRAGNCLRMTAEEPCHLFRRFQMPIREALAPKSGIIDRAALADAGDDILQDAARGDMVKHVAGSDRGHAGGPRHRRQLLQPNGVVRTAPQGEGEIRAIPEIVAQPVKTLRQLVIHTIGNEDRQKTFGMVDKIAPIEMAGALAGAAFAEGQQPAQPAVGGAVRGIDQHGCIVGEIEAAADDEADACDFGCLVGSDDPGERIAVADAERWYPQFECPNEQLFRARRTAQK